MSELDSKERCLPVNLALNSNSSANTLSFKNILNFLYTIVKNYLDIPPESIAMNS